MTESALGLLPQMGMRYIADGLDSISDSEYFKSLSNSTKALVGCTYEFSAEWIRNGSVVLELTDNLAALFSVTTAPTLSFKELPYNALVVKVPRSFLPVGHESSSYSLIAALGGSTSKADGILCISAHTPQFFVACASGRMTIDPESTSIPGVNTKNKILSFRILANTVAFINQHRGSSCDIELKSKPSASPRVYLIRPPRDVVVTRDFRDAAKAAVSSTTIAGIRRALAHVVRGHWRNQPVGEGRQERRLTWVRPHRRGDESLGRVVQRIERLK